MDARVLLVDDDRDLASMLTTYLEATGLQVTHRASATEGLDEARSGRHDAVILDLSLPDGDGMDVCRELRRTSDVPVVMLTARGEDTDRIVGLELGADDYLPKPFNPRELLARLRAVLRRTRPARAHEMLRFGRLVVDPGGRVARLDDDRVDLTARQFDILLCLAQRPGRVLSREQIQEEVVGEELEAFDRAIDVHVSRIRAGIEDDPKDPQRILTVRGAGYLFAERQP